MTFPSIQLQHPPFLPVSSQDGISCGGNQLWFSSKNHAIRGCAPVAAANLTAYLALYHPGCENLYPYGSLDRIHFLKHMDSLYEFLRPGLFGAYHASLAAMRIQAYGASKGVALSFQQISSRESPSIVLQFIRRALLADLPVAALLLHLSIFSNSDLGWHWVTITGLFGKQDTPVLQLSNHGREEFVPFEELYRLQHRWPSFGGSYLAMEPTSDKSAPRNF